MWQELEKILQQINRIVWGPWMIALFIGTGTYFSMRCGWLQIRRAGLWLWESVGKYFKKENRGSAAGFRSVCTMLAATIGTGNLVGVSAALIAGGPGAIFWMWAAALLGMMTAYAENVLGILYSGRIRGPMAYISSIPFGSRLAAAYACFAVCCGLGMGNLTQANTAAAAMRETFDIPPLLTAVFLTGAIGAVFAGGRQVFGRVVLLVIPAMAVLFLAAAFLVIAFHMDRVLPALSEICREAFRTKAAAGGVLGYGISTAMRMGVARGVFTNEAGMGTSVFANEQNESPSPMSQGFLAIFAVFMDTIVMCTLTALVILVSGAYDTAAYGNAAAAGCLSRLPDATSLLLRSFQTVFGSMGGVFLSVLTFVFAFSTLLAWSGFAAQAWEYLTGGRKKRLFEGLFLGGIAVGVQISSELVWQISDLINGGMALINLSALLWCSGRVTEYTKRNIDEMKKKEYNKKASNQHSSFER